MRHALALGALILLAACGDRAEKAEQMPEPGATKAAHLGPPDAPRAPPTFEGKWAPSADLCAAGPFVFEAKRLSAPGGVICEFERVNPISVGYDIRARCAVDRPNEVTQIKLGLTTGEQMTANGGPWGETATLVRCPG
jgi:hypothetical protein